ncbi:carboxypeptidase regulatory-like domain-containing protein [Polyangium sp. y55x31]|uniref:carboxypeptidase regulatory-like domain-containing protein n=1 Tax=Polyangium sp. y55x31 TaxID=3042688 RepID=UPI0024823B28|nr:carboxypeptidase regulatory-like domain-containing protein [Polyangium sp. y55x31]MDI1475898.1 hypothetical protein [Polyangium sp. y55x31]
MAGSGGSGGSGGMAGSGGSGGSGGVAIHEPVGTSLLVRVLDSQNQPVPSAVVTAQGGTPRPTDGAGYILFENLTPGRFSARVERFGYAPASVVVELPEGAHGGADLHLLPLPPRIPFDATAGAALDQGPVHVTIPSDALVDQNGEPVTGTAEATIVPLDPSQGLAHAPGPLEGIAAGDGAVVGLESVFMAEVTLWQGNRKVQLAPGKKATLELVLPDSIAAEVQVGTTIPAWYFDLDAGIWREEGAGTVQGSLAEPGKTAWVAEVGHFSWWNSDLPWTQRHCFIVPVISADGLDVAGISVSAVGVSYTGVSSHVLTDTNGRACVDVLLNGEAKILVGSKSAPHATQTVIGSGPAADCADHGAACEVLSPLTIPLNSVCTPGMWQDCGYGGPPGTLGVGICTGNKKYCNESGTGWTDCMGEVLPQAEDCNSPLDDNCDGLLNEAGNGCACSAGETSSCYTGPAGTVGVGICAMGLRTCESGFFGPCLGQVTPQPEDCATVDVDDNCDGTSSCQGLPLWSKHWGYGEVSAGSIAVDGADNAVIAGYFAGFLDFGGEPLRGGGVGTIFVAKLDAGGNHLWSRGFGLGHWQQATGTAIDSAGNVVITGYFSDNVDFGGGPIVGTDDYGIFVAKFDAGGNHLWSKGFLGGGANFTAVAIDGEDNVVLTGFSPPGTDFGGGPLPGDGVYAVKLDPSGKHLWSNSFGGGWHGDTATAVDSAGHVIITGSFEGTVDFGGGPLVSAGNADIFVVELDAGGNHEWSRSFGDGSGQFANAVVIDGAGDIVITGTLDGTVDFGGGPFTGSAQELWVAKFNTVGSHLWSRHFGGATSDRHTTAIDSTGNVLLLGYFHGTVDLGGGPFTSSVDYVDGFVAKFGANGDHLWSTSFRHRTSMGGGGIATDAAGNVLLTGGIDGISDFGLGPVGIADAPTMFVAKLRP